MAELGSDKTLWLEANAREQSGVSFTKGCYIGQENTARMHYRNKVNRRLVVVPVVYTYIDRLTNWVARRRNRENTPQAPISTL